MIYNASTQHPVVPWAVLPVTIYTFGISLLMPILTVEVMGQFPKMRGLASSLQGFAQMTVFAIMSGLIVPHLFHSGLLLAICQAVMVARGMMIWWFSTQRKAST